MRRKGGMHALSAVVGKVFPNQSPFDRALMAAFAQWCRSMPRRVSSQALPVRLRGGVLTIHTRTAGWANLLQLESEHLLSSLRARYPHCGVRSLAFRPGPLPDWPVPPQEARPKPVVRPLAMLPEALACQLAGIRNDALRDAVAKAAAVGLGERLASPRRTPPLPRALRVPGNRRDPKPR